jgi:tRNA(Ile)-lysidine synthase TilS/MesJ
MIATNENKNLILCSNCILPETFPGIKFDEHGVCKYCNQEKKKKANLHEKKEEYLKRFDKLIKDERDKAPVYDVLMAYSGGKDSSYTLKLLKEIYDLRILALTFDNHFVSKGAIENINNVTNSLQVDSMTMRPPWPVINELFALTAQKDIFSKTTLLRASSICTGCIGIVKGIVLKVALEMSIRLVAFGWSPGQAPIQSAIMKTNPAMTLQAQNVLLKSFPQELHKKLRSYYVPEAYFKIFAKRFPQNIHPLAFFDYDEEKIKGELNQIGWKDPKDTDTNSSNCLINAFANQCHIERHGFHPYVWEIANMVRQGVMNREDGIEKIYTGQNSSMVEYAREKLGI